MWKQKKRRSEDGFEQWGGYMNAKISKLENQFEKEKVSAKEQNEKLSDIFYGVSIFVNGYTQPSADELRCLMLLHGGTYHHYHRPKKTTHIIASALPNSKFDQMETFHVVKPEWITESIKAGKLLNCNNYLLKNDFPHLFHYNIHNQLLHGETGKELKNSKTAADEGYLTEFYNNSRLHYISTLATKLKQYVWEMRETHTGSFPKRSQLLHVLDTDLCNDPTLMENNVIMHIDMDCFFVSVALRNYPQYKGHPVAVTHARGNNRYNNSKSNKKFELEFYKRKMRSKIKPRQIVRKNDTNNSSKVTNSHENGKNEDSEDKAFEEWSKEVSSMSEIASCSYEAREAGVSKGMYLGSALKLCPNLKTIPYDFDGYRDVSMTLYNTVAEYTLDIEAVSCDELFIDCTNLLDEVKIAPLKLAEILRREIAEKTKCTSSVGIGQNKLQARLATKHAKPNGQFHIPPDRVNDFMKKLSVYDLPGVGRTIGAQLESLSVTNCGELQNMSLVILQKEFGPKIGLMLYNYCRGEDEKKLNFTCERKSVSAEVNYGIRFNDHQEAEIFIEELSAEVARRLKDVNMAGKNISFKVMFRARAAPIETAKYLGHGACDVASRSVSLNFATCDVSVISKHVLALYRQLNIPANELRGIGIGITKLENFNKSFKTLHKYFERNKHDYKGTLKPETGIKAESECTEEKKSLNKNLNPTEMDCNVFDSLPLDLKSEILKEIELEAFSDSKTNVPTFHGANHQNRNVIGKACLDLSELSIADLKEMLKEWVFTEKNPQPLDVIIMKTFLSALVLKKHLEKLCILIRCMHRHIKACRSRSPIWQETYDRIVDRVQSCMVGVFGRTLSSQGI
ncbi:hypothetical protein RUM44_005362 [Polyplax serrata]|uniref:DNA repair protein REV1 n=1 Tax=Polyplax serrata TaxID=468196 RepID=A0ABR1ADC3_POLSC